MIYRLFSSDAETVFWIVGAGTRLRHGTVTRPGATFAGDWVPSLCGTWLKVPTSTPYGSEPLSASITERCEDCAEQVRREDRHSTAWNF